MVISIAYRLGAFGFLWAPESENPDAYPYSGNWGLIDQIQAMTWAQTWAGHFTGDVSQATLNGCSAGSESVWWHLVTPSRSEFLEMAFVELFLKFWRFSIFWVQNVDNFQYIPIFCLKNAEIFQRAPLGDVEIRNFKNFI